MSDKPLTTDDIAAALDYNFTPGDMVKPLVTSFNAAKAGVKGLVLGVSPDFAWVYVMWTGNNFTRFERVEPDRLLKF